MTYTLHVLSESYEYHIVVERNHTREREKEIEKQREREREMIDLGTTVRKGVWAIKSDRIKK